jgi:ABC-type transport system involved in multi-copper enzyme maturation permease subunit
MIATIKAEWRKNRFRPAFLIGTGLVGAITFLAYSANWYVALHPGKADRAIPLTALYPHNFVDNVLGAGFPLGAALAIVLGAIYAGSDYGWGTLKTALTQGPGRFTTWTGRMVVFTTWTGIMTVVLFVVGSVYSTVIATVEGGSASMPALDVVARGFGAIWLILTVNGAIGVFLGVAIRQSAAALGVGLVYLLAVEAIAFRFIDSLNNGAYAWIGKLFVDQNANALIQSLTPGTPPAIVGEQQAVLVLIAYVLGLAAAAAALVRLRDVT